MSESGITRASSHQGLQSGDQQQQQQPEKLALELDVEFAKAATRDLIAKADPQDFEPLPNESD